MIGIIIMFFGSMTVAFKSLSEETLNEPFEITLGEFISVVLVLAGLVSWIVITIVLDNHILDYLHKRKRRTF